MIDKKEDYVYVSQDSLKRIKVTGGLFPCRLRKRIARLEDVAFFAEAVAERSVNAVTRGSVSIGMTRIGTRLATYEQLATNCLDEKKWANIDLTECEEREVTTPGVVTTTSKDDLPDYQFAIPESVKKARTNADNAKKMADRAYTVAVEAALTKYNFVRRVTPSAVSTGLADLEEAKNEKEETDREAERQLTTALDDVEAAYDEAMEAADDIEDVDDRSEAKAEAETMRDAGILAAYGAMYTAKENARIAVRNAQEAYDYAYDEWSRKSFVAKADYEREMDEAQEEKDEAYAAAEKEYRAFALANGGETPLVQSLVNDALAEAAPYDALAGYAELWPWFSGGGANSWRMMEAVERAYAILDAAAWRRYTGSVNSFRAGLKTSTFTSKSTLSGFSVDGQEVSNSSSISVTYENTVIGMASNKGSGGTETYKGQYEDDVSWSTEAWSEALNETLDLKDARICVQVGSRDREVEAVQGVVILNAYGWGGQCERAVKVSFDRVETGKSVYEECYAEYDAIEDARDEMERKRDAYIAEVTKTADADYDVKVREYEKERDEEVERLRVKAESDTRAARADFVAQAMVNITAWNRVKDEGDDAEDEGERLASCNSAIDNKRTHMRAVLDAVADEYAEGCAAAKKTYDESVEVAEKERKEAIDSGRENYAEIYAAEKEAIAEREKTLKATVASIATAAKDAVEEKYKDGPAESDSAGRADAEYKIEKAQALFALETYNPGGRTRWECNLRDQLIKSGLDAYGEPAVFNTPLAWKWDVYKNENGTSYSSVGSASEELYKLTFSVHSVFVKYKYRTRTDTGYRDFEELDEIVREKRKAAREAEETAE